MKEVKVNWGIQSITATYNAFKPQFCWLSLGKDGVWNQVTSFHGCRETFLSEVKRFCRFNLGIVNHEWKREGKIDLRRVRIGVLYSAGRDSFAKEAASKAKRGLKIIHLLERHVGWSRSKLMEVKVPSRNSSAFVLSGSAKWMRSPQLMSLYLLAFRLGGEKEMDKAENLGDILTISRGIVQSRRKGQLANDIGHLKETCVWWGPVLDNAEELFFFRSQLNSWRNQQGNFGITNYVRGYGEKECIRRFNSLKPKLKSGKG